LNWTDVGAILLLGVIILIYIVVLPLVEGKGKNGKNGNRFGILDVIGKKIKDAVRWMNRQ
jgi:hypothetical protein